MKECELCELAARMYCESDEASLCWSCDAKVHGANFLVARHARNLLCQVCQGVTAWQASGSNPGPTVSVCEKCVAQSRDGKERGDGDNNDDNQVVPLASGVSGPPPTLSSTAEEQGESSGEDHHCVDSFAEDQRRWRRPPPVVSGSSTAPDPSSLKRRLHDSVDLRFSEVGDLGCSCSGPNSNWASSRSGCEDDANSFVIRRSKRRKEDERSNNEGVVETLERIQRQGSSNSTTVTAICKLCNDSRPKELVSVDSTIDS